MELTKLKGIGIDVEPMLGKDDAGRAELMTPTNRINVLNL
ncbi:hypothetical protein JCM16418A_42600 [Paenibacillus pini]